jgi:class 3 adenylate cyclase
VTVLFCGVAGSPRSARRSIPSGCVRCLRYFELIRAILERHGGSVEKFIGDAVMAVFDVPVLHEDKALRAVRSQSRCATRSPSSSWRGGSAS